jgi:hypothetical protein
LYDAAGWTIGYAVTGHLPSQTDVDNGWKIVRRIEAAPKPVISEDAGFSIQAGREVITNPVQLKNLYEQGRYDPTRLIAMLENHEFGLIILRAGFYPPPVLETIYDAYGVTEVIPMNGFNYELWEPSPSWPQRRQLRDSLSRDVATVPQGETPLTVEFDLPGHEDIPQWVQKQLWRWGWQPLDSTGIVGKPCTDYRFAREDYQATLRVCELAAADELTRLQITSLR